MSLAGKYLFCYKECLGIEEKGVNCFWLLALRLELGLGFGFNYSYPVLKKLEALSTVFKLFLVLIKSCSLESVWFISILGKFIIYSLFPDYKL